MGRNLSKGGGGGGGSGKKGAGTYSTASATAFNSTIRQLPEDLQIFVTPYTAAEYKAKGVTLYLSPSGKSGYGLTREKDLISVFSLPGSHEGKAIVADAIKNGAKTLDCFDGYLPPFYSKFGFKEYRRDTWNDQYAPKNWNYGKYGRPDIVYMKL